MGRIKEWGMALVEERTTRGVLEGLDYETAYRQAWEEVFGFDPDGLDEAQPLTREGLPVNWPTPRSEDYRAGHDQELSGDYDPIGTRERWKWGE